MGRLRNAMGLGLPLGVAGSWLAWPVAASAVASPGCGNGVKEGAEECDDGSGNSDSQKDACRPKRRTRLMGGPTV
jgi:hypothetical protein